MQQPLVTRPAYGECRAAQPVAESKLPEGPPAGKGISLDPSIPGEATFSKPPGDIRVPEHSDESMFRVDDADDLAKDQSSTPMDQRDHSNFKPRVEPGGNDITPKTKYPYRDGIPNAHNAAERNTMSGNSTSKPHDVAMHLRHLASEIEVSPSRSAMIDGLRQALAAMGDEPVVTASDKKYETPEAVTKAMKDLKELGTSIKATLKVVVNLDDAINKADVRDRLKQKALTIHSVASNRVADALEGIENALEALKGIDEILDIGTRSTFK